MAAAGGQLEAPAFALNGQEIYYTEGGSLRAVGLDGVSRLVWDSQCASYHPLHLSWSDVSKLVLGAGDARFKVIEELSARDSKVLRKLICTGIVIRCQDGRLELVVDVALPTKVKAKTGFVNAAICVGELKMSEECLSFVDSDCLSLVLGVFDSEKRATTVYKLKASQVLGCVNGKDTMLSKATQCGTLPTGDGVPILHKYESNTLAVVSHPCGSSEVTIHGSHMTLSVMHTDRKQVRKVQLPDLVKVITALAVHPNGQSVCIATSNGRLLWLRPGSGDKPAAKKRRVGETGQQQGVVDYTHRHWHDHCLTALAFSPNGDLTVSAGERATICFWSSMQTGNDRTAMKNLGAPILELATPPPQAFFLGDGKVMEATRSLVVLRLANNSIAVVNTSSQRVIAGVVGVQTLCVPPEVWAKQLVERQFMRLGVCVDQSSCVRVDTGRLCVQMVNDDQLVTLRVCNKVNTDSVDVGRLEMYSLDQGALKHLGSRLFRTIMEWSRQDGCEWASFWQSRAFAMESDMSSFAVAESQRIDPDLERHQVRFFITSRDSQEYECVSIVSVPSSVTSIMCYRVAEKPHTYAIGTEDGVVSVYTYKEEDEIKSFILVTRIRLIKTARISKFEQHKDTLFVVSSGVVFLLKLETSDAGPLQHTGVITMTPANRDELQRSVVQDVSLGKKWCLIGGDSTLRGEPIKGLGQKQSILNSHTHKLQSRVVSINHWDSDLFIVVLEELVDERSIFDTVLVKTSSEGVSLIAKGLPSTLKRLATAPTFHVHQGTAICVRPDSTIVPMVRPKI
eukprot:Blabericola_migrator_1__6600@NODE_332_length_9696_cov_191_326202_g268_i0_p2_GENE_NODE_332_length_9696_cov_191_326202_g268_i0NODE_332_length_9696_cov_191_326202_g268_i0_p2_ORF_typecomplete_len793_score169_11ANAPC4_WD40/PF12894_7/0_053ANAPC4_WD40/PF12894_7/0_29ANAPC4_WD40/PF12894_7/1_4e03ANAPC4_WD40/PF12894_7/70WD40/PF00400_32/22WD40/PF00400_32/0_0025Ge1_WD40/PF16529_5/2e02Ge1_WD40/PF16529_5/0_021Ge1_WD40/PF16529_5/3_1WD40_like/PF17005_5/12WD40_like/PF17005_5/0_29_NODE_332_length_9696_cov_191_3262